MEKLSGWSLESNSISKDFSFDNFKDALHFVNNVGEIAEKHNHHPDIMINYNLVKLNLTTHSSHGLTSKDFEVALEIDKL